MIFYLDRLAPGETLRFSFRARAAFLIDAATPPSVVYEYYAPEMRAVDPPGQMRVIP